MVANVTQHQLNSNLGFRFVNQFIHPTNKMNFPQTLRKRIERLLWFLPKHFLSLFLRSVRPLEQWTREDVQHWIEYCIDEYSLADVNRRDFQMNGNAVNIFFYRIHFRFHPRRQSIASSERRKFQATCRSFRRCSLSSTSTTQYDDQVNQSSR